MECGYPKGKRFGAIDGTPVASTGGTPARRWLESLTGFLAMELKKYALRSRNHFWQKEKSQILDECCRGKLPKGILSEITTDPETMPENSTWYVMTEIPGLNYKDVGNLYGCRNWAEPPLATWRSPPGRLAVEYGLNQCKNELGWADFRLLQYQDIEKWWEIVFSAYFLVSLFTLSWNNSENPAVNIPGSQVRKRMEEHPQWDNGLGWKNLRMGSPIN